MRVLLVTDWPDAGGGVETYTVLVARGLREAGDDVRLLTSSVGGGAAVADYVAFGSRDPVLQSVMQIANPAAARTIRRAVKEFRPDVVHIGMFEIHLSPSALLALRGVPTVLNIAYYKPICPIGLKLLPNDSRCEVREGAICWRGGCTSLVHWLRDRPRYARIRKGVRGSAAVTTCSRWMQHALADDGIDSRWQEWPIDRPATSFHRTPATTPRVVYTGRLSREKGVDTLLHALARARKAGAPITLGIVGDGPLRPALERLSQELGLTRVVEFTGWVPPDRVESQLANAWALVAPSRWAEPLGLSALEALVRGIPVVASATGGLAENVEQDVSGLLFPNGNIEALAGCLLAIAGRQLSGGVPLAVVERVAAAHDLGRHIVWLREVFAEVVA